MRLVAEDLCGERGGYPVFSGIEFSLGAGRTMIVTGPNGVGKSTLLRVLAGLLPVAAGRVALEDGGGRWPTLAGACHYLGHQNAMKAALTVRENLEFWRRFNGEPQLSVFDALAQVGLETIGDLPFAYLSTGQKRRVSLAKLLVSHRPVWLLDEPTAGLDKASEAQVAALIDAHCEDGGIVVAATHVALAVKEAATLDLRSAL